MIPVEVIITIATAVGSWLMKKKSQDAADLAREREFWIKSRTVSSGLMDAAAKRSSPWTRKFVATFVIVITFGGLIVVAFRTDIPVSIIQEIPQNSFLWGLIRWGKGFEVISANGFVLPDWVRYSVCTIIGFLFGPAFAKTR